MTEVDKDKLVAICKKFIEDNNISCSDSIYQSDKAWETAPILVHEIAELIGYVEYLDD